MKTAYDLLILCEKLIMIPPKDEKLIRKYVKMAATDLKGWINYEEEKIKREKFDNDRFSTSLKPGSPISTYSLLLQLEETFKDTKNPQIIFEYKGVAGVAQNKIITGAAQNLKQALDGAFVESIVVVIAPNIYYGLFSQKKLLMDTFTQSLYNALSHEWTHTLQYRNIPDKYKFRAGGRSPLARKGIHIPDPAYYKRTDNEPGYDMPPQRTPYDKYISRPIELMAWAQGIAAQLDAAGGERNETARREGVGRTIEGLAETINNLHYGTPAYKLFMRHFIDASLHRNIPREYLEYVITTARKSIP